MTKEVLIVGAGIVGICCGLALQSRGWRVTLLDKDEPAGKSSRWNAGVLSTGSLYPLCAPGMLGQVPKLLSGRHPGFRMNRAASINTLLWGRRFLARSVSNDYEDRVTALHNLIGASRTGHETLLAETGGAQQLHRDGWLHLFESEKGFEGGASLRAACDRNGVDYEVLGADALAELEPHLARRFRKAVWFRGSAFVTDPAGVAQSYLALFSGAGGKVLRRCATGLGGKSVILDTGEHLKADAVVVATGPWSGGLLKEARLKLPMIAERGHVQRLRPRGNVTLGRPVNDVGGGIILSPRADGIQVSTGTELTTVDTPSPAGFIDPWLARAREVFPLEDTLWETSQPCNRPTLPDSLPAIGPVRRRDGLWLCTGHQHIGFMTAPGSANLLAAEMSGEPVPAWAKPFTPERFGL